MQKFKKGDHVRVAKTMPKWKSHFPCDKEAIVVASYYEKFGGDKDIYEKRYTIHIKGLDEHSWYDESQLTLIEANRLDLLKKWRNKEDKDTREKSNLDWIFSHGKEVLKKEYGASLQALFTRLGGSSLWGSRGEGWVYLRNAMSTILVCEKFLKENDRRGFEAYCKLPKEKRWTKKGDQNES